MEKKHSKSSNFVLPEKLRALIHVQEFEDRQDIIAHYDELWRNSRTIRKLICLLLVKELSELMRKDEAEETTEEVSKHIKGRRQELRRLFKLISDSGEDPFTWLVKHKSRQEI